MRPSVTNVRLRWNLGLRLHYDGQDGWSDEWGWEGWWEQACRARFCFFLSFFRRFELHPHGPENPNLGGVFLRGRDFFIFGILPEYTPMGQGVSQNYTPVGPNPPQAVMCVSRVTLGLGGTAGIVSTIPFGVNSRIAQWLP